MKIHVGLSLVVIGYKNKTAKYKLMNKIETK